jgi:hypothetical protein
MASFHYSGSSAYPHCVICEGRKDCRTNGEGVFLCKKVRAPSDGVQGYHFIRESDGTGAFAVWAQAGSRRERFTSDEDRLIRGADAFNTAAADPCPVCKGCGGGGCRSNAAGVHLCAVIDRNAAIPGFRFHSARHLREPDGVRLFGFWFKDDSCLAGESAEDKAARRKAEQWDNFGGVVGPASARTSSPSVGQGAVLQAAPCHASSTSTTTSSTNSTSPRCTLWKGPATFWRCARWVSTPSAGRTT